MPPDEIKKQGTPKRIDIDPVQLPARSNAREITQEKETLLPKVKKQTTENQNPESRNLVQTTPLKDDSWKSWLQNRLIGAIQGIGKVVESAMDLVVGGVIAAGEYLVAGVSYLGSTLGIHNKDSSQILGKYSGEVIEFNRNFFNSLEDSSFNKYFELKLGFKLFNGSIFGGDKEFASMEVNIDNMMRLNALGHLSDSTIAVLFDCVDVAINERERVVYNDKYKKNLGYEEFVELQKTDQELQQRREYYIGAELVGSTLLIVASGGGGGTTALKRLSKFSNYTKMLKVPVLMAGASALSEELSHYDKEKGIESIELRRFLSSLLSGTANNTLFLAGLNIPTNLFVGVRSGVWFAAREGALARSLSGVVDAEAKMAKFSQALKQSDKFSHIVDITDGFGDLGKAFAGLDAVVDIRKGFYYNLIRVLSNPVNTLGRAGSVLIAAWDVKDFRGGAGDVQSQVKDSVPGIEFPKIKKATSAEINEKRANSLSLFNPNTLEITLPHLREILGSKEYSYATKRVQRLILSILAKHETIHWKQVKDGTYDFNDSRKNEIAAWQQTAIEARKYGIYLDFSKNKIQFISDETDNTATQRIIATVRAEKSLTPNTNNQPLSLEPNVRTPNIQQITSWVFTNYQQNETLAAVADPSSNQPFTTKARIPTESEEIFYYRLYFDLMIAGQQEVAEQFLNCKPINIKVEETTADGSVKLADLNITLREDQKPLLVYSIAVNAAAYGHLQFLNPVLDHLKPNEFIPTIYYAVQNSHLDMATMLTTKLEQLNPLLIYRLFFELLKKGDERSLKFAVKLCSDYENTYLKVKTRKAAIVAAIINVFNELKNGVEIELKIEKISNIKKYFNSEDFKLDSAFFSMPEIQSAQLSTYSIYLAAGREKTAVVILNIRLPKKAQVIQANIDALCIAMQWGRPEVADKLLRSPDLNIPKSTEFSTDYIFACIDGRNELLKERKNKEADQILSRIHLEVDLITAIEKKNSEESKRLIAEVRNPLFLRSKKGKAVLGHTIFDLLLYGKGEEAAKFIKIAKIAGLQLRDFNKATIINQAEYGLENAVNKRRDTDIFHLTEIIRDAEIDAAAIPVLQVEIVLDDLDVNPKPNTPAPSSPMAYWTNNSTLNAINDIILSDGLSDLSEELLTIKVREVIDLLDDLFEDPTIIKDLDVVIKTARKEVGGISNQGIGRHQLRDLYFKYVPTINRLISQASLKVSFRDYCNLLRASRLRSKSWQEVAAALNNETFTEELITKYPEAERAPLYYLVAEATCSFVVEHSQLKVSQVFSALSEKSRHAIALKVLKILLEKKAAREMIAFLNFLREVNLNSIFSSEEYKKFRSNSFLFAKLLAQTSLETLGTLDERAIVNARQTFISTFVLNEHPVSENVFKRMLSTDASPKDVKELLVIGKLLKLETEVQRRILEEKLATIPSVDILQSEEKLRAMVLEAIRILETSTDLYPTEQIRNLGELSAFLYLFWLTLKSREKASSEECYFRSAQLVWALRSKVNVLRIETINTVKLSATVLLDHPSQRDPNYDLAIDIINSLSAETGETIANVVNFLSEILNFCDDNFCLTDDLGNHLMEYHPKINGIQEVEEKYLRKLRKLVSEAKQTDRVDPSEIKKILLGADIHNVVELIFVDENGITHSLIIDLNGESANQHFPIVVERSEQELLRFGMTIAAQLVVEGMSGASEAIAIEISQSFSREGQP